MKTSKDSVAILGIGAAACAACCAGPIIGFLAAIGLGTAAGAAVFGLGALLVGATIAVIVVRRRRRRRTCTPAAIAPQPIELTARR